MPIKLLLHYKFLKRTDEVSQLRWFLLGAGRPLPGQVKFLLHYKLQGKTDGVSHEALFFKRTDSDKNLWNQIL